VLNTAFIDDDDDDDDDDERGSGGAGGSEKEEQEVKRRDAVLTMDVLPSQIFGSHCEDKHDGCCHPECNVV